jgi:hypothetical protein
MSYVLLDTSIRKKVETATIKALLAEGIPLTSSRDRKNRHF